MRQFRCDTCQNNFNLEIPGKPSCPACGSLYVTEIGGPDEILFWTSIGFIISMVLIVIMFIVLFMLPEFPKTYQVAADQQPGQCKIIFSVSQGGKLLRPEGFRFSIDSGNTWFDQREFIIKSAGMLVVQVKAKKSGNNIFHFQFPNPLLFKPTCVPLDPCDCKKLEVLLPEIDNVSKPKRLIIHASLPRCPKEYSITGDKGIFQSDSVFPIGNIKEFSIYVRSGKCLSVAYRGNPFKLSSPQPVVAKATVSENSYDETDVDLKPFQSQYSERQDLIRYLKDHLTGLDLSGTLTVRLVILTDGTAANIHSSPNNPAADERLKSVFDNLGSWSTGYKDGQPVPTRVTLTISF